MAVSEITNNIMIKKNNSTWKKGRDEIAIIGMACRFPGNISDANAFWQALMAGQDLVTEVPAERFATQFHQHDRRDEPGRSVTFKAGIVEGIGDFDPVFFGISPREALKMDPQQRILLELTWHALEDAGVMPAQIAGTQCGVFIGISATDYGTRTVDDLASMNAYSMLGGTLSIAANRISYVYDLHGPSLSIDTACSSSLVALHTACESIKRGESKTALVGGVNLLAHPFPFVGFSHASMLSSDGRSKSFSADANGYVRSEGGAVLMLKPLRDALRDGNRIHTVIRATGTNADGGRKTGITMPSTEGQIRLLQQVLGRSGIDPAEIDYVEAHGTGTAVGDPVEIKAIGSVYGSVRQSDNPLPVGSVKSNLGHMEPASGMAGLVKAILALQKRQIPSSIHSDVLNPHLPLNEHHIHIVRSPLPITVQDRPLRAAVNSFGFGGTNAHAIIESLPHIPAVSVKKNARVHKLPALVLSAKDHAVLLDLAQMYADLIESQPGNYELVATSAAQQRQWLPIRLGVMGQTPEEIVQRLREVASQAEGEKPPRGVVLETVAPDAPLENKRRAFVYGGNGAQWQGMGLALMRESPYFARKIRALDRLMSPLIGFCLIDELKATEGSSRMSDTAVTQPLLFAIQVALTQLLESEGIAAEAYVGHSVGEIAAAWASGCLTLEDAAKVVAVRSQAQAKTAGSGRMLAAAIDHEDLASTLTGLGFDEQACTVAGFNAPRSLTLVGDKTVLTALNDHWEQVGIFARLLDLDYAFHSEAMEPVAQEIITNLGGLKPRSGTGRFVSTVTGLECSGERLDADYWWRNVRQPVQFESAISTLVDDGISLFIEISPHAIMQRYITQCAEHKGAGTVCPLPTARKNADGLLDISEAVLRIRLHTGMDAAGMKKTPYVDLPKYPWRRQRYWAEETSEGYNLIMRERAHPLLGYPLKDAPLHWENILDPDILPYLADHKVDGAVVLPGAAYVEIALAAARLGLGWQDIELRALEIHHPLVFEDGKSRTLRTSIYGTDHRFTIQSRRRLSDDEWVDHAVGQVREAGDISLHRAISLPQASDALVIEAASHYRKAKALGLDYGPSFQGISALTLFGTVVLASLDLPQSVHNDQSHILHPASLDLCFQSLLSLTSQGPSQLDATYLPVQIGRLISPHLELTPSHFQGEIKRISPHSVVADFSVLSSDGRVISQLTDCRFRAAHFSSSRAMPQLWETRRVPLHDKGIGSVLASSWPDIRTQIACAPSSVVRQRYFEEVRPLLDALTTSYAYEAVAALVDDQGGLPEESPAVQVLYERLLDQLAVQGYVRSNSIGSGRYLADAPPSGADIWTLLNQDYPEANCEATLIARLGGHLSAVLLGRLDDTALTQEMAQHSALLNQWREEGLAARSGAILQASFWDGIGRWVQKSGHSSLRVLMIGGNPAVIIKQLRGYLPSLGVSVVASSPNLDNFAAWPTDDPQHVTLLAWAQCLQKLEQGDLVDFDVLWVDGALTANQWPEAISLARAVAGGLAVIQQPVSSWYVDFISTLALGTELSYWGNGAESSSLAQRLGVFATQHTEIQYEPGDTLHAGMSLLISPVNQADSVVLTAPQMPEAQIIVLNEAGQDLASQLGLVSNESPLARRILLVSGEFSDDKRLNTATVDACRQFLALLQQWARVENAPAIYMLLPFGALDNTDDVRSNPVNAALWGMARVAMNEQPALNLHLIDPRGDWTDESFRSQLFEVIDSGLTEREIILDNNGVHVLRAVPFQSDRPVLSDVSDELRYELGFTTPGQLRNLHWQAFSARALAEDEVELKVHAVGLNFRDVMFAMGLLGDEAVENGFSGASLGLECAGVVTRVGAKVAHVSIGDAVLGFGPQCFASHVVTRGNAVAIMPSHWQFSEAATVPTVFFTVYYSLIEMARLRKGERVLIHGGAGGIGIAAIQLAQHMGAEIYATAGSDEKRDFLRLMGVKHIYSSRDMRFADQIMADTQGEGVDVVLNSLAGEAIERNLDVLRPFGRFLELGKRDFYANTPMGLRPFKENISYFGIDADQLMSARPDLTAEVFRSVMALFSDGVLHPLPYLQFSADNVIDAFRTMQQARHIGKLVVDMIQAPAEIKPMPLPSWKAHANASYLITGGLTGFGFETARWLLERGAGRVILASRRGKKAPNLSEKLRGLGAYRSQVEVVTLDVTDVDSVTALCQAYADAPHVRHPLRGIIHAAMVLDDALIQNLDAIRMDAVITPKIAGAWNLHCATQGSDLDFFVVYSSVTTLLGNAGQSNYVAANAALEALVRLRRGQGLPGSALCWGPISDAGYLTEHQAVLDGLENRMGGAAITSSQALSVLERSLQQNLNGLSVMNMSRAALQRILPEHSQSRFAYLLAGGNHAESSDDENVKDALKILSPEQAKEKLAEIIQEEVAHVLGLPAAKIDQNQSIYDMGLDSLMAVELALGVEKRTGFRLSAMALNEGPTVSRLAERVLSMIQADATLEPEQQDQSLLRQIIHQHSDGLTDEEQEILKDLS
jgi:phthiocerol/phenolphthiocerol synthesis type-I polyketide synthase C